MARTNTWNTAWEESPSDGSAALAGAARMMAMREAVRERMELDHKWDVTNTDDITDGYHDQTTLLVQSAAPAAKASAVRLYSIDVSAKAELYVKDEDGDAIQLTNGGKLKTLDTVNAYTKGQAAAEVTLSDGATVTPNCNDGNTFAWTIGGNRTLANPSNPVGGQVLSIIIKQDATGSRTIAYGNAWLFPNGIDTDPADGANEYSIITAQYSAVFSKWISNITKDFV